jgi:phosphohistidine phosphatase SixA
MRVLIVRHGTAGDRGESQGDDRIRPLDEQGTRQADLLASTLAELGAQALYSSPALRCVQTLEPAAMQLGLAIETRTELFEDAHKDDVLELLEGVVVAPPALCTHGELFEELLPGRECEKGAIWVVEVEDGEVRPERYLPPPA